MQPTAKQIKSTEAHWSGIAGESVKVDVYGGSERGLIGSIYGFASELGCRRIMERMSAGRVGYSENLKTWFFVNG